MPPISVSDDIEGRKSINKLFQKSPILVEVRFPHMGTSPDWYLFEEEAEFTSLLARLATGVEIHLSSVWDLKTSAGELTFRK